MAAHDGEAVGYGIDVYEMEDWFHRAAVEAARDQFVMDRAAVVATRAEQATTWFRRKSLTS